MRIKSIILSNFILLPYLLSSQNVGIGTTTPTGRLQINHRSTILPGILLMDSASPRAGIIRFGNVTSLRWMEFQVWNAGTTSSAQYLDIRGDSTYIATFKGNGNFGLGVINPVYRMDVDGVINSTAEYRLNGKTALRLDANLDGLYRNVYAGDSAGFSNTIGFANSFIGGGAGVMTTNGYGNSFLGSLAGYKNTVGTLNTYVGVTAGQNSNADRNTFIGSLAGSNNVFGSNNTMLGSSAGENYVSGNQNTLLGALAGYMGGSGLNNVFVGYSAGSMNNSGSNNSILGAYAQAGASNFTNATAIGYRAYVNQSNSIVLGSINGVNEATADTRVGIGTTTPTEKLDIVGNIKVSGELNHPSTGTTNLLPIAFGSVSSTGIINSGSGNFTVTRTAAGSYTINIAAQSYNLLTHTTVVTAIANPFVSSTSSASSNLLVRLYNLSGVLTDCTFHFVTYRQ